MPAAPAARWRTLALALRPSTRALALSMLGGLIAMAVAPTVIEMAKGGRQFTGAVTVATLVLGGALAFAVDDPAIETLSASPTTLARRHGLRFAALALAVGVVLGGLWLVADAVGGAPASKLPLVAAELAAGGGVSLAVASSTQRTGNPTAAQLGAITGPVSMLVVSALSCRITALPAILTDQHHDRWWIVAAAAWLVVVWSWRDVAR